MSALESARQRGMRDQNAGHPGPDAADVADLVEARMAEVGMIDVATTDIDWTEAEWDAYRQSMKAIHAEVGNAYAKGADSARQSNR